MKGDGKGDEEGDGKTNMMRRGGCDYEVTDWLRRGVVAGSVGT